MADKFGYRAEECGARLRFRDMGDGSYAPVGAPVEGAGETLGTGGEGTTSASAQALGAGLPCRSVLLSNTHATLTLKFGSSVSQPVPLAPGAYVSIPCTNANQIYVIDGTGHATFAWLPVIAG